ncbi:GntR family transcriptional regulator [Ruegeria pomeroyi]|uniref:GntR family transcriptional regulator n=1 Tax=Ruegeria pomeroyi TaxID=89184 RepID=A0A9Q3WMT2_9RHOB|nr:GntR family transcriptional regulator [Ruegeria pomeroyi]MCE8516828.1 GntR family transcriptional regulator [Ruegeria pomeroyi]MCE8538242.1 GntR family transcriptional regulator [Ruegeria pomeroyi]MCE8556648.1 GntR family transcriptional regulator [Ruegeria pomeroyi]
MAFKSLSQPRLRLADQVYEQIMAAIRAGDISAQDRIVQEKLAEQFEISRTPVREALFRMEQEGILEVAGHGGFRIRQLDLAEIRELYGSRCAIEAYAARLLASNGSKAIYDSLRETISKAEDLRNDSVEAYFMANYQIHRAIVEASENRYLLEFSENIWNRGSSFTVFSTIRSVDLAKSLGGHMALIDAIETKDGSIAAAAMIDHINEGLELQIASGQWE